MRLVLGFLAAVALAALPSAFGIGRAQAAEQRVLRIGSGGLGGTYHPIATIIGHGLTGVACEPGAACGMPGVVAVAQVSNGSVANVEGLAARRIELGLIQGNVADEAFRGTGAFARRPVPELRAVAALFVEALHVVARAGSGISSFRDLKGRRVSLDEPGSGTLQDARAALAAHGMGEGDVAAEYMKPVLALEHVARGRIDAFFITAGAPVPAIAASDLPLALVPLEEGAVAALVSSSPHYAATEIEAGTYRGVGATRTVGTAALLVAPAWLDEGVVHGLTQALWSERTRSLLVSGHARGRDVRIERALDAVPIPLHPGAERFYREAGLIP